ncbi:hypothetical protein [Spectribacter hydrogenoxidans]|uniref:Phenylacetate-CoA ligase n=1 Tax=Spectribacter hydrogenoxidans TaxID=3075608 RepID=A0ABU3C290_9GAMM|nr:hypothetical protein [Salinisphaera sp. W335]MDT0635672.1 hypothetical protein [Salinisphaera sp. W335]
MTDYWSPELETKPWSEVQAWQAQCVSEAVPRIRETSRLYAGLLAETGDVTINAFEDLQRLPFTGKEHLKNAQADASATEPFGANQAAPLVDIVQTVSSSGTSGVPLYYPVTRADVAMWTDAIAQNFFTAGIRREDVIAHLVGLPGVAGGLPYAEAFREIGATLCWLGGFPTERILREMRRLHTTALLATTSFGTYLSETWDEVGETTGIESSLRKVLCGGEPGLDQPAIRHKIETGLGIDGLREVMGMGDVIPGMWGECDVADGMHFNAQRYVAVELIDPDSGEPVPWSAGATGELVYTTFQRDAAPLIRYRSRDHAQVVDVACACGRTSPRLRCIGRTDDMLIYKGMNVFPTAIRDVVAESFAGRLEPTLRIWKAYKDLVRFDEAIPVDVEACEGLAAASYPAIAGALESAVRSQMQVRIRVTVLEPGGLPRGAYKNALVAVRENK